METKKRFKISLTTQILIATVAGIVFGSLVGPWAANLAKCLWSAERLSEKSAMPITRTSRSVKRAENATWDGALLSEVP